MGGNPRNLRLAEQIHKIIAQMLERRIKDPRLGFITITEVRVTGDGREATVCEKYYRMIHDNLPTKGKVDIITITDRQYGNIINYKDRRAHV